MGRKLVRPKKESKNTGDACMKFIHSIWFSILILVILFVVLTCGCQVNQIKGKILGDPNQIAMIQVPAGSNVAGIVVPKQGVYLSEEILQRIIEGILQDGFKLGYEMKQNEQDKSKRI